MLPTGAQNQAYYHVLSIDMAVEWIKHYSLCVGQTKLIPGQVVAHRPKITMCNAMYQLEWCKAYHRWTPEQRTYVLLSDDRTPLSGSLMNKSGLDRMPEHYQPESKHSAMFDNGLGLFQWRVVLILQHSKTFGIGPYLFQHDNAPVHNRRSIKTWFGKFNVRELAQPAQDLTSTSVNTFGMNYCCLWASPSQSRSVPDPTVKL